MDEASGLSCLPTTSRDAEDKHLKPDARLFYRLSRVNSRGQHISSPEHHAASRPIKPLKYILKAHADEIVP